MSMNLFMEPIPKQINRSQLSNSFRRALEAYWRDFNISFRAGDPVEVGKEMIPALRGMVAAGDGELASSARALVQAINENGRVKLSIEE